LTGQHLITGATLTEQRASQLSQIFGDRVAGGDSSARALAVLDSLVRREAYVLAYIDAFWIVAWILTASLLLLLLLRRPAPHPLHAAAPAGDAAYLKTGGAASSEGGAWISILILVGSTVDGASRK